MLHVHRAERADRLADGLAEVLREPLADPFAADLVSVPSKGVERWLAQRLSHRLGAGAHAGVCANVVFPSVTAVIEECTTATAGPDRQMWQPRRLVWSLLEVIDQCVDESWCGALGAHLGAGRGDDIRRGRRYATARHIAELFDSYGRHRPDMLTSWSGGDDVDGTGGPLPPDLRWQPELWRRLRKQMTVPSPAERLAEVCHTVRDQPDVVAYPQRLSVFGLTRLPAAHIDVLTALAQRREVHLWLPHPSPALWDRIRPHAAGHCPLPRSEDPTRDLPRHPLLASLGRDARELQLALAGGGAPAVDHHHDLAARPDTLLGRVQAAIAADDPGAAGDLPVLDPADRSVQVHACHGPQRQVEVLREVILGLLTEHPDLEPRDVLVMCPDIETFAPLISASFGLGAEDGVHPGHRIRVRLADRALRQVNPLFGVVALLLELADSRLTAADVLDLAASASVRRRFRLDDDVERLRDLVSQAGVRWGLDPVHRSRFQLGAVRPNTWAAGLDRILLGVAMSEDEWCWVDTALPLDDVDSSDVDLVGRLAELVDRLGDALAALSGERPVAEWLDGIRSAVDTLTAVSDADAWQLSQVNAELTDVATAAAGQESALSLADIRALLGERLRGQPTRANFRTGDLTMCTLVPMRSVPHRVVCVLGLDDGVFPRTAGDDGDDVLARNPCVGERDRRSEDRQLLLDAVMAATDTLVLVYSGADERTNAHRPAAVPLEELLDTIGPTAREQVVVRHPLQPFNARNFTPGALGLPGPFSFDRTALAGARAAAGPRAPDRPFLLGPLPRLADDDTVQLDELRRFFDHPVRAFLRRRLGVTFFTDDEDPADGLPVELEPLQQWEVGDRLLRAALAGVDLSRCIGAEWRRGSVPPGKLGKRVLDRVADDVTPLAAAASPYVAGDRSVIDVFAGLPDGRQLAGSVADVYGDTVATVTYSRLGPKHRLRAWVHLLALTIGQPGRRWCAVSIGRGDARRDRGRPRRSTLGPLAPAAATAALATLVQLYDEGLGEPLPLVLKASHEYACCRTGGGNPDEAAGKARQEWTRFRGGGESDDAAHALVWGTGVPLDVLLAKQEGGGEPTRFGALAMRLWVPLFDAETIDRI